MKQKPVKKLSYTDRLFFHLYTWLDRKIIAGIQFGSSFGGHQLEISLHRVTVAVIFLPSMLATFIDI